MFSVVPISAQLELFPNGDYIARSNLVERFYKRINPDDWDDDEQAGTDPITQLDNCILSGFYVISFNLECILNCIE